jgi:hypothetical protein
MTRALKEAFYEASKLADGDQDSLAAAIRAEIEAEKAWESGLESSAPALERLSDEALHEHASGRTRPLDLHKR